MLFPRQSFERTLGLVRRATLGFAVAHSQKEMLIGPLVFSVNSWICVNVQLIGQTRTDSFWWTETLLTIVFLTVSVILVSCS